MSDSLSLLIHAAAKVGKALSLDTPVVTPTGWSTIGELRVGDQIFDGNGNPTTVVALSPIWTDRPCYRIDVMGDSIVADEEHIWKATPVLNDGNFGLYRTKQLKSGRGYCALPWSPSLNLPDADLAVHPYILGLWLGDGTTKGSQICAGPERREVLDRCVDLWGSGEVRFRNDRYVLVTLPGLITKLREIGALDEDGVKQIPAQYLRAGTKQRHELLAGLLDSDGHVTQDAKALISFGNTNKNLIDGVHELSHTIGLRALMSNAKTKWCVHPDGTRVLGKPAWGVHIRGGVASDNLTYRSDRQHIPIARHKRFHYLYIQDVVRVPSVPVRCIQVANADGMFLAGKTMIPTHNSTLTSTAPTPILVLDAEGSWKFIKTAGFKSNIPLRKIEWDPRVAPPRHDGTWDYCHVAINKWTDLTMVYQWLTQAQHDFVSLVLDSISEAQRKLKENISGTDQMKIQDWGTLLTHMDKLIRNFRDLTNIPGTTLRCVVFVSETRLENGKWRPYMQGQISVSLPYWVDICSYLYPDNETDENGQNTQRIQKLLIAPREGFETGERVQGRLPDIVTNPNITEMLTAVYANGHSQEEETVHAD